MKAIIADDETELRNYLRSLLAETWPELVVCGEAANGKKALELVENKHPQIAFLDIRMPGLSGMDVAKRIAGGCHIVFVTAYDRYAVEAFEREAVDYLLKPVSRERLLLTKKRLLERIEAASTPSPHLSDLVQRLLSKLSVPAGREYLQWIKTHHRDAIRLIPVEEIDYFKADDKYTMVMTGEGESLIRTSIRELAEELDPARFWQIHRGTIVNASRIESVSHSLTGRGVVRLKGRSETLTVSRSYLHLFKQM
ncbi:MAG: DNA-binding response regulator [Desulfobacteraceae bacterium]|nr:MAG: DNA-binding response regulator [Desulfobacteraceae bacterium]